MRLCYFISEYPAVSHTFIRREIIQLGRSRENISVLRVSLRKNARKLVDPADLDEKELTKYILEEPFSTFVRALVSALACRPRRLFNSIRCAVKMMRRSNRPIFFHLAYLAEALVLAKWVVEERVDHIHAHFATNGAEVAMLTNVLTGVPYSFTVHGPDEFDRPEYLGLAEKVKHAAFVCAVSHFTISQLCRWIPPGEWKKIKLVRCGLDADYLTPRVPTSPSPDLLVSVGRLSEQKGQLVLLEALAALMRDGVQCRMVIAGDGPLRSELERRIQVLGLADRVEITGWLSNAEIRARMLRARAVILPSFAEGLPVTIMEALALGRPVISTYVAGIPELVTDGVCGWLVPAGSVRHLCNAITECLQSSDLRIQTMGRAGRKRVLEMHDVARESEKLANLIRGHAAAAASPWLSSADADDTALSDEWPRYVGVGAIPAHGGVSPPYQLPPGGEARRSPTMPWFEQPKG